jgi:hypothetical protein
MVCCLGSLILIGFGLVFMITSEERERDDQTKRNPEPLAAKG